MITFLKALSRFSFLFGLAVLLTMLPFSKYVISVSQFILAGAWAVDRFETEKVILFFRTHKGIKAALLAIPYILFLFFSGIIQGFRSFLKNKPALIFSSIILLHVLGLFFTVDFGYAFKDIRTKLPIILLPLFLSTSEPIGKKGFQQYLILFVLAITLSTIINTIKIYTYDYVDLREVSRQVSHVRLGLLISLSLLIILYYVFRRHGIVLWVRGTMILLFLWQLGYLFLTKSFTGIAVFGITVFILLLVFIFRSKNRGLKFGLFLVILLITGITAYYLSRVILDFYHVHPVDFLQLEKVSSRGNPYIHNPESQDTENGNRVWIYVQMDELREGWNQRSSYHFDSLGRSGEVVAFTLIRYLASKDLRKDADGLAALTREDIQAIEKGIPNVVWLSPFSIRGRIYEILWGFEHYRSTDDPSGMTLMQRFEYWKAAAGVISSHWLAGVGTGDMNIVLQEQYDRMHSKLNPDERLRPHNQFLSIFAAFGIFGILWFLLAIFYPPYQLRGYSDYFFLAYLIIALLSMIPEDTLESQTGVTFFALFYSFFLFFRKAKNPV
jgi:hypothetical protein